MEAIAALAMHGLVLASLLSGATTSTLLAREAWTIHAELFAQRQVEHLLDGITARAGSGPGSPQPVAEASAAALVLHADANGDGVVDPNSSERTELELRAGVGETRVLFHRIGRQSMRIEERLSDDASFRLLARDGGDAATVTDAACISVPRASGTPLFAVLAARAP
jgi:hypothetical protein